MTTTDNPQTVLELRVPLGSSLEQFRNLAISKAVTESDGSLSKAARLLGIGRSTLYRMQNKAKSGSFDQALTGMSTVKVMVATLDDAERAYIFSIYAQTGNSVTETCKQLKLGRSTLYRWLAIKAEYQSETVLIEQPELSEQKEPVAAPTLTAQPKANGLPQAFIQPTVLATLRRLDDNVVRSERPQAPAVPYPTPNRSGTFRPRPTLIRIDNAPSAMETFQRGINSKSKGCKL